MAEIELNERLLSALRELQRHEYRNSERETAYWWRTASMQSLAKLGLTEAYVPVFAKKAIAHRLTPAGKAYLAGLVP